MLPELCPIVCDATRPLPRQGALIAERRCGPPHFHSADASPPEHSRRQEAPRRIRDIHRTSLSPGASRFAGLHIGGAFKGEIEMAKIQAKCDADRAA